MTHARVLRVAALTVLAAGAALAEPYRVRPGDTLGLIASRHGTTVSALQQANPSLRDPRRLMAGQVIELPGRGGGNPKQSPDFVTVKRGDTLSGLATRHGVSQDAILAVNTWLRRPYLLREGQRINLPVASRNSSQQVTATTADRNGTVNSASFGGISWVWPLAGIITSGFGKRALKVFGSNMHEGVDIAAPVGTVIRAARGGRVTEARFDYRNGWGGTVVIDHGDGYKTRYSHNSKLLVKAGQVVQAGQAIANVGSTGISTGPHLDYRIYKNGKALDPANFR